jgi:hypothetical protein
VSRLAAVMVTGCEVQRRCGKPSAFQVLSSINPETDAYGRSALRPYVQDTVF